MFTILRRSIKVVKMTLYQCCIGVRPVPRKPERPLESTVATERRAARTRLSVRQRREDEIDESRLWLSRHICTSSSVAPFAWSSRGSCTWRLHPGAARTTRDSPRGPPWLDAPCRTCRAC